MGFVTGATLKLPQAVDVSYIGIVTGRGYDQDNQPGRYRLSHRVSHCVSHRVSHRNKHRNYVSYNSGAIGDEEHMTVESAALTSLQQKHADLSSPVTDTIRSLFVQQDHLGV